MRPADRGALSAALAGLAVMLAVMTCSARATQPRQPDPESPSPDQARRGMSLYLRKCTSCHGAAMRGGEGAPALVGQRFIAKWTGKPAFQLSEKIRITMPQDDPGTLQPAEAVDLMAAILLANGMNPAGARLAPSSTPSSGPASNPRI